MRRRLLWTTVIGLAVALIAFALPLGVAVRGLLTNRALDALEAESQRVATFIDERARTCGEVRLILALSSDAAPALALFGRSGELVVAPGTEPVVTGEVTEAARGSTARAVGGGRLAVAVPLSTAACGARLVLHAQRPVDALATSVRRAWLGIAAVGVGVLGLAAAGAWWLGRRLADPFEALADSARRLGEGDFTARAPRSGLPEADAIAEALDTTADRLDRALQRGRTFTADASHQLRTPLTALRLQLDALAAGGADPGQVEAAHEEADRLEATVEELVALTEPEAVRERLDVGALVAERVEAWRPLAADQDRAVRLDRAPTAPIRIRPAAVGQALQVLLDNALEHGRGEVTVRVEPSRPPGDRTGEGVRVAVCDEGPGPPGGIAGTWTGRGGTGATTGGRGLDLARSLVEAEGGRLTIEAHGGGTRASLVLPGRRDGPRFRHAR